MVDYIILSGIALVFIAAGIFVPIINAEYGLTDAEDYDSPLDGEEPESVFGLADYVFSIASMFFWSFGALPIWVEMFFLLFRFVFWFMVVEVLWIG